MLTAKLTRSYKSKKGNTVFVYTVNGNETEIADFATAQGDNHRVDEATGKALFFTTRCFGDTGTLIITSNGNVVPDMSAFDQADSLAKQYGGNLGKSLADRAADSLLGNKTAQAPAQVPNPSKEGIGDL